MTKLITNSMSDFNFAHLLIISLLGLSQTKNTKTINKVQIHRMIYKNLIQSSDIKDDIRINLICNLNIRDHLSHLLLYINLLRDHLSHFLYYSNLLIGNLSHLLLFYCNLLRVHLSDLSLLVTY